MFKIKFINPDNGKWITNILQFERYNQAYSYGYANYNWTRWQIVKV